MRSVALRLLAFAAVLLLPFAMAAAPAAAHPMQPTGAMAMDHCPEAPVKRPAKSVPAGCTMACSAALPAADLRLVSAEAPPAASAAQALVPTLSGIELELATPPPKRS